MSVDDLLAAARRQARVIAIIAMLGLAIGLAAILTATPRYTASTIILIDPTTLGTESQAGSVRMSERELDVSSVESQVEVLRSDRIALAVVANLNLEQDPRFRQQEPSPVDWLRSQAGALLDAIGGTQDLVLSAEAAAARRRAEVVDKLRDETWIRRVEDTYVLSVNYSSPFADLAARIANAFVAAYLEDQQGTQLAESQQAGAWMLGRLDEVRDQALAADLAVQRYREENDLLMAGDSLLGEQQLIEANRQMMQATSDRVEAEARWRRLQQAADSNDLRVVTAELLDSPVVGELRIQYNQIAKRLSEIEDELGTDHPQAERLRADLAEYQRLIGEEIDRIAESYENEFEIAKTRESLFLDYLDRTELTAATRNVANVRLRQLERNSDVYRSLYESFLNRYQNTIQQQTFPLIGAQVISPATPPLEPSYPRKAVMLAMGLLGGLFTGAAIGGLREFRDRGFRSGDDLRHDLDVDYLGALALAKRIRRISRRSNGPGTVSLPPIMRQCLDTPQGAFFETLRNAKRAVDMKTGPQSPKVIGIVSTLPGEGKTTLSANLAMYLAKVGARTILLDGDLRNSGLTKTIAPGTRTGLAEVFEHSTALDQIALREPETGLRFYPAVPSGQSSEGRTVLSQEAISALLRQIGQDADYVVVDLPPLALIGNTHGLSAQFDGFFLIVEWGRAPRKLVASVLADDPDLHSKILGTMLNKVRFDKMRLYADRGSKDFYRSRYVDGY